MPDRVLIGGVQNFERTRLGHEAPGRTDVRRENPVLAVDLAQRGHQLGADLSSGSGHQDFPQVGTVQWRVRRRFLRDGDGEYRGG